MRLASRNWLIVLALVVSAPLMAHSEADKPAGDAAVIKEQKPWGIAGDDRAGLRTIEIVMTDDMRFTPDRIQARLGETLRFRIRNRGHLLHELVIGTRETLEQHAEMMRMHPGMEHDEPYMSHVAPGKNGDMLWTFNRAGTFGFACLIPGHYEAGMVGTIEVRAE